LVGCNIVLTRCIHDPDNAEPYAKFSGHRKRKPTFIDFGPPHPNQLFTALIWGEYRDKFDYVPESLLGKTVCVSGKITEYKGKAEIKVSDPTQIRIMEN
jgi:hypothetical protein